MKPPSHSIIDYHGIGGDPDNRLGPMTRWLVERRDLYAGKRVLDLASNAGHFPMVYAANGAESVTAVEPRAVFGRFFDRELGRFPEASAITWLTRDVRQFVPEENYGVLSCLGLIYHMKDGWSHLARIVRQCKAKTLIFDSMLWPEAHTALETGLLNTNCAGLVEQVNRPSKASVEAKFMELGWSHELVLENWQRPKALRGMWLVNLNGTGAMKSPAT